MFGRPLRTRLDLLEPNFNRKVANQQHEQSMQSASTPSRVTRQLKVGDAVIACDYWEYLKWGWGRAIEYTDLLMYKILVNPT